MSVAGGNRAAPCKKEGPPRTAQRARGPRLQLPTPARSSGGVWGGGHRAPPPHPQQEVAGRGWCGPPLTRGALAHWPRAAPTAGRGPRGRAGAGPDMSPPAGALHLAAAGERLPCPCPALLWPLRPPSPPLRRGGRAQAASNPSCRSSLPFFPPPVWHGHH